MRNNRKNEKVICMILEDISSDFSKELVKNVANAISENKQVRLVVLPVKYDYGMEDKCLHRYREMYNNIFRFSDMCSIDGLIIHLGSAEALHRGIEPLIFLNEIIDIQPFALA